MKRVAIVLAVVVTVLVGGAVFGAPRPVERPAAAEAAAPPGDLLRTRIESTQERLRRVPADWTAWAGLGLAYLEQSRVTTDPSFYPKAEQAVQRSLQLKPDGNTPALVARGAIANARHDFAAARRDALAATRQNPYSADAYGVLADAETQLGHRAAATAAVQRLLDLRPGLSAYARASYDLEQRGLTGPATQLMTDALGAAVDRHDVGFCRVQLGDLALGSGDTALAATHYAAGLAADPISIALRRGQARLDAALGRTDRALAAYDALTRRAPAPAYLLEYAELLAAAGHPADARAQRQLAGAAHQLFTANGGVDGITGALLAEANGHPDEAVRQARAEWGRRQHADVADTLAWALHLAGDDRAALTYARVVGVSTAGYSYHIGMIENALGAPGAREHLTRALALNPHFSPVDAPIARHALTELGSR